MITTLHLVGVFIEYVSNISGLETLVLHYIDTNCSGCKSLSFKHSICMQKAGI